MSPTWRQIWYKKATNSVQISNSNVTSLCTDQHEERPPLYAGTLKKTAEDRLWENQIPPDENRSE